ncbi:MAG: hypothetical protein AB7R89_04910 [Dehalococcoidia bacterium]
MTKLLERAIAAIALSDSHLAALAREARVGHRRGKTLPLNPDVEGLK